jgi:GT2 family glycosyltransferase
VFANGLLQEAGGIIFRDGSGWNFGRGDVPTRAAYQQACEVDYCSAASLLVRRDLFERLGGLDLRYAPAYYEDVDLCFGIRRLGYRVMYCPGSVVIHFEGITNGTDTGSGFKRYQVLNRGKFVSKWREALARHEPNPAFSGRRPLTVDRSRRLAAALVDRTSPALRTAAR